MFFITSFRHGLIIMLHCGRGVGMLFVLRVVGPEFLCSILHSVPCPWLGFFRLRYSVLCVCVFPLAVCLDIPFIAGMVS